MSSRQKASVGIPGEKPDHAQRRVPEVAYTEDAVNRLANLSNSLANTSYAYRADGMRVAKVVDHIQYAGASPMSGGAASLLGPGREPVPTTDTTLYRYDGQMPIQEVRSGMNGSVVIDSALGARGVEAYSKRVGTGTATIGYPLYDAHGNNVATLTKAGSNSWSILNTLRAYDAWGNLIPTSAQGDPSGRYCANLGHVQDDESGLVYMRARYYEPGTGRFISEDPARQGSNLFTYCANVPVNRADISGKSWSSIVAGGFFAAGMFFTLLALHNLVGPGLDFIQSSGGQVIPGGNYMANVAAGCAAVAGACYALGLMAMDPTGTPKIVLDAVSTALAVFGGVIAMMTFGAELGMKTVAGIAVGAAYAYGLVLIGALVAIEAEAALR